MVNGVYENYGALYKYPLTAACLDGNIDIVKYLWEISNKQINLNIYDEAHLYHHVLVEI
jgi:hypothetical protein